jgi:hypothetical protein
MQQNPETALEVLKSKDAIILNRLVDITITSREEQKSYEDDLISARQAFQRAEDMRKSLTEPLRLSESRINALFKPYTSNLISGINKLCIALDKWRKEQSDISETKLLSQAEEYWQKRNEAKGTGEIIPLPSLNMNPPPKTSYANMGSVSYREVLEVRVVDPLLVPRDLCEPVLSKIRKRAESGVVDIPGVVCERKFVPYTRLYNQ